MAAILGLHNIADLVDTNLKVLAANGNAKFSEWHGNQMFSLGQAASIERQLFLFDQIELGGKLGREFRTTGSYTPEELTANMDARNAV
jgi:hypothetical protein